MDVWLDSGRFKAKRKYEEFNIINAVILRFDLISGNIDEKDDSKCSEMF